MHPPNGGQAGDTIFASVLPHDKYDNPCDLATSDLTAQLRVRDRASDATDSADALTKDTSTVSLDEVLQPGRQGIKHRPVKSRETTVLEEEEEVGWEERAGEEEVAKVEEDAIELRVEEATELHGALRLPMRLLRSGWYTLHVQMKGEQVLRESGLGFEVWPGDRPPVKRSPYCP